MRAGTRDRLVGLLALLSGATDAIGLIGLGGAFTSVMTGNMVLLGVSVARASWTSVTHPVVAIVFFIVGAAAGARMAGTPQESDPIWPRAVTRTLSCELLLMVGSAVVWITAGGHPTSQGAQLTALALSALALGMQSSATLRFGVPGLSTTYLTGTLTGVVNRLVSGLPVRRVASSLEILASLIIGAGLGATLALHASLFAPLLQVGVLCVVLVCATWQDRTATVDQNISPDVLDASSQSLR